MNSTEAKDVNDNFIRECENAGGQLILETFDIGLVSKSDDMQYYNIEEGFLPLYHSKYLDVFITGYLDCVHAAECKNLTEFTKYMWGGFYNSEVYNFTLYDIVASPASRNELDLTCLDATLILFDRTDPALDDSWNNMTAFMIDMCRTQPNNVCSLTNVTDTEETEPHLKLTINMNTTEADEVNNNFREVCNNIGGRLAFEIFDFNILSNTDEIKYYSIEKEDYEPLYHSTFLHVSFAGYADCFYWPECLNSSDVVEMNIMDWEWLFNASVYNFTLHQVVWDDYTM
jgi:hypothetical protein